MNNYGAPLRPTFTNKCRRLPLGGQGRLKSPNGSVRIQPSCLCDSTSQVTHTHTQCVHTSRSSSVNGRQVTPPPPGSSACSDTRPDHRVMNGAGAEETGKAFLSLCHVTQLLARSPAHSPVFPCSPSDFIPSPSPEGRLSGASRVRLVCGGGKVQRPSSGAGGNRKYIQCSAAAAVPAAVPAQCTCSDRVPPVQKYGQVSPSPSQPPTNGLLSRVEGGGARCGCH